MGPFHAAICLPFRPVTNLDLQRGPAPGLPPAGALASGRKPPAS